MVKTDLKCTPPKLIPWVGKKSFSKKFTEWDKLRKPDGSNVKPPEQMCWCGSDAVLLYFKKADGDVVLMIGPYGGVLDFHYPAETLHLVQELDSARVITTTSSDLLQRVPKALLDVKGIGSEAPGALLADAAEEFEDMERRLGASSGRTSSAGADYSGVCYEFG